MQYKTLFAGAALAVSAYAQDASQSSEAAELLSVVSVLQTALPSSLIQEALTNSAAVSSEIASEFAAGETPSWFSALPSDVQTYLVPAGAVVTANATGITSSAGTAASVFPTNSANGTANGTAASNSRTLTRTTSATLTESSGSTGASGAGEASATGGSASSTSSGGASVPTAIYGMSLAGAVGLVGVLAL